MRLNYFNFHLLWLTAFNEFIGRIAINISHLFRLLYNKFILLLVASLSSVESVRGIYNKAAVATDNGICSEIGKDILLQGGNAVDAIIAAAICTGATNAHSSGLGGGHFLTVYNK